MGFSFIGHIYLTSYIFIADIVQSCVDIKLCKEKFLKAIQRYICKGLMADLTQLQYDGYVSCVSIASYSLHIPCSSEMIPISY